MVQACVNVLEGEHNVLLCPASTKWIDDNGDALEHIPAENIDTREAKSPARRVALFWQQINRCSSFYGMYRRDFLIENFKFPPIINSDFYFLINVASHGDVKTASDVCWYRRVVRKENNTEKMERYNNVLELNYVSKYFPLITSRVVSTLQLLRISGPIYDRLKLVKLILKRFYCFDQSKILFSELLTVFKRLR